MHGAMPSVCPSPTRSFDRVLIGFGLRNVTHQDHALAEMYRVLRPAGMLIVLEFSQLTDPRARAHLRCLLLCGAAAARDASSSETPTAIDIWPSRFAGTRIRRRFLRTMAAAGFERCACHNLTCGIVAVHQGFRL